MYSPLIMDQVISVAEGMSFGEVPVFSAVAIDEKIIATAGNDVEGGKVAWRHAEFLAVEKACEILGTKYLETASIYVTLEPCAFCASVLEKVRIKDIFFGAYDPKCGAITHNVRLFDHSTIKPNIVGGIQEERCSKILKAFFEKLRGDA